MKSVSTSWRLLVNLTIKLVWSRCRCLHCPSCCGLTFTWLFVSLVVRLSLTGKIKQNRQNLTTRQQSTWDNINKTKMFWPCLSISSWQDAINRICCCLLKSYRLTVHQQRLPMSKFRRPISESWIPNLTNKCIRNLIGLTWMWWLQSYWRKV